MRDFIKVFLGIAVFVIGIFAYMKYDNYSDIKGKCQWLGIFKNDARFEKCMENMNQWFAYSIRHKYDEAFEDLNIYNELSEEFNSTNSLANKSEYVEVDIEEFTKQYEIDTLNFDANIDEILNKKITFKADYIFGFVDNENEPWTITMMKSNFNYDPYGKEPFKSDMLYHFDSDFQNYEMRTKANRYERLFLINNFSIFSDYEQTEEAQFYGYFTYNDEPILVSSAVFLIEQVEFPKKNGDDFLDFAIEELQERITHCKISKENLDKYVDLVYELFNVNLDKNSMELCELP